MKFEWGVECASYLPYWSEWVRGRSHDPEPPIGHTFLSFPPSSLVSTDIIGIVYFVNTGTKIFVSL